MRLLLVCLCIVRAGLLAEEISKVPIGGDLVLAVDSFRSLPDGSYGGNMGTLLGLNLAIAIPYQGIGVQMGGSYGIYDFSGHSSSMSKAVQQEAFVTF